MEKDIVKFLDYEIVNTNNGDGWILLKPSVLTNYECHLGNYSNVESAKKYAIHFFMIARPEKFSAQIAARMNQTYIYMDYFTFIRALKDEDINIPEGVTDSNDSNFILTWNGEKI